MYMSMSRMSNLVVLYFDACRRCPKKIRLPSNARSLDHTPIKYFCILHVKFQVQTLTDWVTGVR